MSEKIIEEVKMSKIREKFSILSAKSTDKLKLSKMKMSKFSQINE